MSDDTSRAIKRLTITYETTDGHTRTIELVDSDERPLTAVIEYTVGIRELDPFEDGRGPWRQFESDGTARVEVSANGKYAVSSSRIEAEAP